MTNAELIKNLAQRMAISQKQARALLEGYTRAIVQQLQLRNTVVLRNFGSFSTKEVAEKKSYLPATDQHTVIPAHSRVHFKPAPHLKEAVKGEEKP